MSDYILRPYEMPKKGKWAKLWSRVVMAINLFCHAVTLSVLIWLLIQG